MSKRFENYPLDLDASLKYTRFPDGVSIHPYPGMIGNLALLLGQYFPSGVTARNAPLGYGPGVQVMATQQAPNFSQITFPQTPKLLG